MEEVPQSAASSEQFSDQLPEPMPEQGPENETNQDQVTEADFDKRNEQLRPGAAVATMNQDEATAAGMIALGDVLKQRQEATSSLPPIPQGSQRAQGSAQAAPYPNPVPTPRPMPQTPSMYSPVSMKGQRQFGWAIAAGIIAAMVATPFVIYLLG